MINDFCRRCGQDPLRRQAQEAAQAIIAQARQAARETQARRPQDLPAAPLEVEEEPMNRYVRVITRPAGRGSCPCQGSAADTALAERTLETLTGQTQLLIDLLAAVNSLTAAVLGIQARMGE